MRALWSRRKADAQRLAVLDSLASVIECASMQCFGEGKFELLRLCERLEAADAPFDGTGDTLRDCREALALIRNDRRPHGVSVLCRASRRLWDQMRA